MALMNLLTNGAEIKLPSPDIWRIIDGDVCVILQKIYESHFDGFPLERDPHYLNRAPHKEG